MAPRLLVNPTEGQEGLRGKHGGLLWGAGLCAKVPRLGEIKNPWAWVSLIKNCILFPDCSSATYTAQTPHTPLHRSSNRSHVQLYNDNDDRPRGGNHR